MELQWSCKCQRQLACWSCNEAAMELQSPKANWAGVAMELQWSCKRPRQLACWFFNKAAMKLQSPKAIDLLELQIKYKLRHLLWEQCLQHLRYARFECTEVGGGLVNM